jgi:hypothetical protein
VLCSAAHAAGCGGGSPLLHGAQTLPAKTARWGAGVSATFAAGGASDAVAAARATATTPTPSADRDRVILQGAAVSAAMAPAVAPWVSGRVGLENRMEAGLAYTGRSVRLDGRHAFEWDRLAISVGLAGSVLLAGPPEDKTAQSTYIELDRQRGWGVDLPVLLGWQDKTGIVTVWAGPRGGFEKIAAALTLPMDTPARTGDLSAQRWYVGPVTGLAIGFRHVHAAAEIAAYYQNVRATALGFSVKANGVALVPAAALNVSF